VGRAIYKKLTSQSKGGTALLKFIYGRLYNGKLAQRHGHATTDECSLCHKPDSCTHIEGECPDHEALRIGRHNVACQLIHAAIHKAAKGGGALHCAPDLVLVATDTCTLPQTTANSLETFSSFHGQHVSPQEEDNSPIENTSQQIWLEIPGRLHNRHNRHTDLSQKLRYTLGNLIAAEGDAECTAEPRRIPEWILSHVEI
jgi:hypothetical protein